MAYNGDRLDRYDDDDRRDRRGSPIWPWIVGLLVLLLIGGGVAAYLLTRPKKTLVPYVVYLQLPAAQKPIQDAGFTPNVIPETSNYPVNEVINQSPLGNSREKAGSTVTLTVLHRAGLDHRADGRLSSPRRRRSSSSKQNGLKVSRVVTQTSSSVPQGAGHRDLARRRREPLQGRQRDPLRQLRCGDAERGRR